MPGYEGQGKVEAGRIGDWCQTYSGARFWPLDPRPEDIRVEDIAHALSLKCRFNGHCREFYSVADHSIRVMEVVVALGGGMDDVRWGLLHDAAEAYLPDVPRPLKHGGLELGRLFREAEARVVVAIASRFDLPWPPSLVVKRADDTLLATEARDLMNVTTPWYLTEPPLAKGIVPRSAAEAEAAWLAEFGRLFR